MPAGMDGDDNQLQAGVYRAWVEHIARLIRHEAGFLRDYNGSCCMV
jgi:hypothetical protein